jgi:hypothetical protein
VPLARRLHIVPWQAQPPVGLAGLSALLDDAAPPAFGETAGPP